MTLIGPVCAVMQTHAGHTGCKCNIFLGVDRYMLISDCMHTSTRMRFACIELTEYADFL